MDCLLTLLNVLTETAAREARSKRWDEAQQLCKTMPRTIITEITSHCKVWSPSAIVRLHLQGMATPMIRTICTLDPDDSDASGKRGHVNIEVCLEMNAPPTIFASVAKLLEQVDFFICEHVVDLSTCQRLDSIPDQLVSHWMRHHPHTHLCVQVVCQGFQLDKFLAAWARFH